MRTCDEILERLREEKLSLFQDYPLKSMEIFGSVARNEAECRDVDILVDVDPEIGIGFVNLANRLEEILEVPVDLVSKRAVDDHYFTEIQSDLICV